MKRKTYWKEVCFLLIGFLIGHYLPLENKTSKNHLNVVVQKDSIYVDTFYVKSNYLPPLTKKNLKAELIRQNIPHHQIVLAQAIHETGNFTSRACKVQNNLFGLRKGNSYRSYSNYRECVKDYKRLISKRYKGGDYYDFIRRIGYAEDPEYINKLKKYV